MPLQASDLARLQVTRLAFRCLSGFVVAEAQNFVAATGGDIVEGVIFIAVAQRHGQTGVTANGLAASLGVPAETVRRKVLRLMETGLIERGEGGLLHPPARPTAQEVARRRATFDGFMAVAATLKGLGFAPELFAQPPARPDLDEAEAVSIIDNVVLRMAERGTAHYGSITRGLIFTFVMYLNSLPVTYDPTLAWRYSGADTPPPDHLRRPVSALAAAQALHLPRETMRRHLKTMTGLGMLEHKADGYLTTRLFLDRPEVVQGARMTVQAFEQVIRDLTRAGCDFRPLPGPPPLAEPAQAGA